MTVITISLEQFEALVELAECEVASLDALEDDAAAASGNHVLQHARALIEAVKNPRKEYQVQAMTSVTRPYVVRTFVNGRQRRLIACKTLEDKNAHAERLEAAGYARREEQQ